jgi:methionyl-tRNA formyltransferase
MIKKSIVVATIKSWNICNTELLKKSIKENFNVVLISKKEDLKHENLEKINPKYIFFPHWSWIIPKEIYNNFECIVFHMTDLPFGRGGSPLQNLIIRKVHDTKISALRVNEGIDTGKVYMKRDFSIAEGNANSIFTNLSNMIFHEMIPYILNNHLIPKKQTGTITTFTRRSPEESNMNNSSLMKLHDVYDFIRMLDGEGYPKAFILLGKLKIFLSDVEYINEKLYGKFEIVEESNSDIS